VIPRNVFATNDCLSLSRLSDRRDHSADSIPSLITIARIHVTVSKMQYDTAILDTDPDVVER